MKQGGRTAHPAFNPANLYRFQRGSYGTNTFALILLRADPTTHRRQKIGVGQLIVSAAEILFDHLGDETGNVDADRAAFDTGRLRAHQASLAFQDRIVYIEAKRDLVKIPSTLRWVLNGHTGPLLRYGTDRLTGHCQLPPFLTRPC